MTNIKWGDNVKVSAKYRRQYYPRKWVSYDENHKGIFIGYRTIQDGYVDWDTGEYGTRESGNYFVPTKYIRCGLVVFSAYTNPVYVPLDKMELIK